MLTCPAGFVANGLRAGIKPSGKPDLAVVLAPGGATAAAMLTSNAVRAAPLIVTARNLSSSASDVRAVLINAGCANAATGDEGERRAVACTEALAKRIGCRSSQVLVNSTGVIGVQLPEERVVGALDALVAGAAADGLVRAAEAIMTTDTRMKVAEATGRTATGEPFRVVGIAKGAGMIHPALVPHATMIVVILVDAAVEPSALAAALARACDRSFHRISIDGDTSTNDAVFALASGVAGRADGASLDAALTDVSRSLALQIVRDGEGATKLIHVRVAGARSAADALAAARTVALSMLVRTAVAGGDPNWGRILAALGRSGASFELARLAVHADRIPLFAHGAPCATTPAERARIFKSADVAIVIDLAAGTHADEFFTCDLTEEYVRVNAEYTT
ncbi:MAG: bifunctional glutamate N-acetyltransferase/amino-acid acetyltransferase ArgJ [Phycisphaerales bacterium]